VKRERDLQIEYKTSFTNNTNNSNNINNNRTKTKYTNPILSFPELGAPGTDFLPKAARQQWEVPDWTQQ